MTTYDATSDDFRNLKNPYTGEAMHVKMLVGSGEPKFFCPDTYSTAMRFPGGREMYAAWCRTDGVLNTREGEPIRCAYTGEFLTPEQDDGGHYFSGGFDPRIPRPKDEFLHFAWMRKGESPYALGDARAEPVSGKSDPRSSKTIEADATSEKLAEGVMERSGLAKSLLKQTVVNGASLRKAARK